MRSDGKESPNACIRICYGDRSQHLLEQGTDFDRDIADCVNCSFSTLTTLGSGFFELRTVLGFISRPAPGDPGEFSWTFGLATTYRHFLNRAKLRDG